MKTLLLIVSTLAMLLSSSPAAPAQLPEKLSLYIGGFGGGRYWVDLAEGSLRYKVQKGGKETVDTITPTAEQWVEFEKALDGLHVWEWKKTYSIPSEDGTQWSATIIEQARRVETTGNNAYPPDFKKYLAAVQALLGGKAFD